MTGPRGTLRACVLALLAGPLGAAAQQPVAAPRAAAGAVAGAPAWTRITYISGTTVYLEVGSKAGLTEGSALDVVRAGAVIARLRVSAVASTRAACEVTTPAIEMVVGDSVRFIPAPLPAAAVAAGESPQERRAPASARRTFGLRGRLGLRYLVMAPAGGGGGGLQQPAYDLRLDGQHINGGSIGVIADVRAQRTQYASNGTQAARSPLNVTRVYQAALSWTGSSSGARVTLGRQFAPALSTVGLYDGLGIDLDRRRWSTGGFVGSQPDAATFGTSGRVREYGLYGQWHTRTGSPNLASLTLGGVGSYVGSDVDREYAFARFTSNNAWLSVYATQELDFNRGWKLAAEHAATTPTATFVSVQVTPVRAVSLFAGLDNRRSVRLYRDYVSPEIAFDDSFRQGTWGGLSLSSARHVRLSLDRRESHGGTSGDAVSTTALASLYGISPLRLGLRARGTQYSGTISSGQLVSGSLEIDPWGVLRLEASGGSRDTRSSLTTAPSPRLAWYGLDADISVGRSVYVLLSAYREREGGGTGSTQTYASLSWRF
jgi:hypothetical protein